MAKKKSQPQDIAIGHRLSLIRWFLDLDQADIAKRFGESQNIIALNEGNFRRITHQRLKKYKDLVGCSIDWIITGEVTTKGDRNFLEQVRYKQLRRRRA
jgi:transcriptional regulator with XRE-family HTH domain